MKRKTFSYFMKPKMGNTYEGVYKMQLQFYKNNNW